jgi:iron(III) transport system substrate-binding protein
LILNMKRRNFLIGASALALTGCQARATRRVVLYCSVDDVYARPIVRDISERTGIAVEAVYDVEAAKTAGLANRIRAEASRPRGDIFWSSALLQTLLLQREGLLQPHASTSARDIAPALRNPSGAWHAIGTRQRVLVFHNSVSDPAQKLDDLLLPRFKNKIAISNPQFGTASDWCAALGARLGTDKTLQFFRALKKNGVQVLAGNSVVAERVAAGEVLVGVTDADDFAARHKQSPDIRLARVHRPLSINAVRVPGSAAILKNAPHLENAKVVLDALLDARTERQLSAVMTGVELTRGTLNADAIPNDTARWAEAWQKMRDPLNEILNA